MTYCRAGLQRVEHGLTFQVFVPESGTEEVAEMAISERVRSLQAKHARIETELSSEEARPSPDGSIVASLKKEKLRIKDELARIAG